MAPALRSITKQMVDGVARVSKSIQMGLARIDAGYAIRVGPGTNLGQHRDGSHHHEEQHRNGAVGCHPRLEEVGNPRLCRASNQLDGDGGASIQSDVGHLVKIAEDTNQKGRIARAAAGGLSPTRVVRPEESPVMVRNADTNGWHPSNWDWCANLQVDAMHF